MRSVSIKFSFSVFTLLLLFACAEKDESSRSDLPYLGEYRIGFLSRDTIHYRVTGAKLLNENGTVVNNILESDSEVKIVNFFFSRCPSVCPLMNTQLQRLSREFKDYDLAIHSISIDPEYDTYLKLKEYRQNREFSSENWQFYTGSKKEIFAFAQNCKLKAFEAENADENPIHEPIIVLLDARNHIRGYYNSLQATDMKKIEIDIRKLIKEIS